MFKFVIANEIFSEVGLIENVFKELNKDLVNIIINHMRNYPYTLFDKKYNYSVCISNNIEQFATFVYEQDYIDKSSSKCIFSQTDYIATNIRNIKSIIIKTLYCTEIIGNNKTNLLSVSIFINNSNISLRELEYIFQKQLSITSKTKKY